MNSKIDKPSSRTVTQKKTPTLVKFKSALKDPKRMIMAALFVIAIGIVPFASALTHTVEKGDTLWDLAKRYNTSIEEIAEANDIPNVNLIQEGQKLTIADNSSSATSSASSAKAGSPADGAALKAALDVQFNIDSISPTSDTSPSVSPHKSCMRFNFLEGKDATTGSQDGVFVLFEDTNGALTSWYGAAGAADSGWIDGFNITHRDVHVKVLFYPNDGHAVPVLMTIVNPAPSSSYGWLSRGSCHAIEIEYPG